VPEGGYASAGSISSADDRELELLFSGEHHYLFQAAETVKKIKEDTRQKRE